MRRVRARPGRQTRRLYFVSNYNLPLHSAFDSIPPHMTSADPAIARLLNPIVLLEPDRIVAPPSWLEHVPFAFWIVAATRPRVFVELGTHTGNSYAAFAQAIQHLGLDAAAYSVDTWKGDTQAGFYGETVFDEWRAYHDRHFSAFSRLLRATFDEARSHFLDGSIDLLHLDGCHTLEAVRHDVDTWLPKLSDRGVLLMHDTNVRERDFGAWKVWEDLRERYPGFEFLHGHGLGVLAVGREQSPDLAWLTGLTAASPAAVTGVRWFFSRIAAAVALRHQLEAAAREHGDRVAAAVQALRAEIGDAGRRNREAEVATAALTGALEELELRSREHAAAERASQARLEEVALELAAEARARAVEHQMTALPAAALAEQQRQADSLRSRAGALQRAQEPRAQPAASRWARLSRTCRDLGLAPSTVVRNPAGLKTLVRLAFAPRRLADAHVIAHSGVFDAGYYGRDRSVAASGTTALAHFVVHGGRERRSPHLLFDSAAYVAAYPDVAASGINPLVHYLRRAGTEARTPHPLFSPGHYRHQTGGQPIGVPLQHYVKHGLFQGLSPHPLFDADYYVRTYGTHVGAQDPLQHFIDAGAAADFNPHPLFDTGYYRSQVPELAGTAVNPLVHYLQSPAAGRRPHPLFDPAFYLATYQDVAAAGVEPLTHFVLAGGAEGRFPTPEFDSAWYLAAYPDVAAGGFNPLVHFVTYGWLEGRNPSRHFDSRAYLIRYPDVLRLGGNPLRHYVLYGAAEGRFATPGIDVHPAAPPQLPAAPMQARNLLEQRGIERVVVCLTHVPPIQPRAGNEYRIHRMLHWLRRAGYTIVPVFAPTDGSTPSPEVVRAIAAEFGNAVVCPPNGQLQYILRDLPDVLRSLDFETTPPWQTRLGEHLVTDQAERAALTMDRAFCTDAVISTMLRLQSALAPYALIAEYIWMSRVLPLVGRRALRIIDTIDVFSNKDEKVGQFGIDDLTISREGEALRLRRADLILAIQGNEQVDLAKLVPGVPVITTGVDFDINPDGGAALPVARRVMYVASGNPMNRRGLKDFLRFAWPRIRAQVSDAELEIAGRVADAIPILPAGVTRLGLVEDLTPLYRDCRVVINPAVAGTGLKIKTIEALSYLRPIVTWPNGVDGLSPEVAELCLVAKDWPEFAGLVVRTLVDGRREWFDERARAILAEQGSAEAVYATLARELERFFAASSEPAEDRETQ